jgi:hypothetical protein
MPNDTVPASAESLPNSDFDAELIKLGSELEEVHRQRLEIDGPDEYAKEEGLYTAHWALREKIEAIPAKTKTGRRIKARAVEMALHFDPDCECDGIGSFVTLSQSLCRDLLVDEKPATAEERAAIDFKPWVHADDEWTPPTEEEWREVAKTHLVTVRLAWHALYKTKAEMVTINREMDEELGRQLMEAFRTAIHFFESTAKILSLAETRIICAGSVVEIEQGEGGDDD